MKNALIILLVTVGLIFVGLWLGSPHTAAVAQSAQPAVSSETPAPAPAENTSVEETNVTVKVTIKAQFAD